ncbi:MAG: hypothetical protein GX922_05175 [Firmicutes bacterium]|nr:hypothetical protein [Bacillota bacterium]
MAGENLPDVLGLNLAEAIVILENRGIIPQLQRTAPPRGSGGGKERVVRVLPVKNGVLELTVAAENWGY